MSQYRITNLNSFTNIIGNGKMMAMDNSVFSKRIKEIRAREGLTQRELGQRLGLAQQSIASWEAGRSYPDALMLAELSTKFQVSTDYLLGLTDSPEPFPEITAEEMADLKARSDKEAIPMTKDELVSIMPIELQDAVRTLIQVELIKAEERKKKGK